MHDPTSTADTLSDARAIERSRAEPELFATIYDRHFTAVYRYVASRLGRNVADDLTAEVFLAAFGKRDRFDPSRGADCRAWLYGFATNIIRRHRRDEIRHYQALQRVRVSEAEAVPSDGDLEARLDARARRPDLASALMQLAPGEQDVLLLVAICGLSYAEVIQALGIRAGTVKSRLSRARAKLRALLGDQLSVDTPDTHQGDEMSTNDDLDAIRALLDADSPAQEVRPTGRQALLNTIKRAPRARPSPWRRGSFTAGSAVLAAAASAAIILAVPHGGVGPHPAPTSAASQAARTILLTAASNVRHTSEADRFWMTRSRATTVEQVGPEDDPYQVRDTARHDIWIAATPSKASWSITQGLGAHPATPADKNAWRRDGSPITLRSTGFNVTLQVPGSKSRPRLSTKPGPAIRERIRHGDKLFALGSVHVSVHDLRSLPSDASDLRAHLTALAEQADDLGDARDRRNGRLFEMGAALTTSLPTTTKTRAATYRMLADLPGVESLGTDTDNQGRKGKAVAITRAFADGSPKTVSSSTRTPARH